RRCNNQRPDLSGQSIGTSQQAGRLSPLATQQFVRTVFFGCTLWASVQRVTICLMRTEQSDRSTVKWRPKVACRAAPTERYALDYVPAQWRALLGGNKWPATNCTHSVTAKPYKHI